MPAGLAALLPRRRRDLHQRLLLRCLGVSSLDGLSVDLLHALMKDRAGSHLMEVGRLSFHDHGLVVSGEGDATKSGQARVQIHLLKAQPGRGG